MNRSPLEVRPIAGALGAEIVGVDLTEELDSGAIAAIRAAWLDHLVIFFRGQSLSPECFLAFARRFGEVIEYPFIKGIDGFPEITPVIKLEQERVNFGGLWHSDTTYLERPPIATMLIAREVPPFGGDTLFANMYLAYETLSAGMQRLLDGLVAVNSSAKADVTKTREDRIREGARTDAKREYLAEHPVVRTHPQTGRKALYVNGGHTLRFSDMTEEESAPAAAIPVRPSAAAGIHLPLPLGGRIDRPLGQSLRAAQPDQRLSRLPPRHAPRNPGRRYATLSFLRCAILR
jgi:taurine dioxygenase